MGLEQQDVLIMIAKYLKMIFVVLILAAGGFAYYMHHNGLDPLDINDIKTATSSTKTKIDKISKTITEKESLSQESKVYKRKDAQGNWYYSNEPPKEGDEAEVMTFRSDTNVLPPLPEDNKKKN